MSKFLTRIFGASWEGKVSAIIVTIAGLGVFSTEYGVPLPHWLQVTSGIAGVVAAGFGLSASKSNKASTAVDGTVQRVEK